MQGLSDPRIGARLLLASLNEAKPYVEILLQLNSKRQTIERNFSQCFEAGLEQKHLNAIILFDENWHPGVMGNIATKISRQFQKPRCSHAKQVSRWECAQFRRF